MGFKPATEESRGSGFWLALRWISCGANVCMYLSICTWGGQEMEIPGAATAKTEFLSPDRAGNHCECVCVCVCVVRAVGPRGFTSRCQQVGRPWIQEQLWSILSVWAQLLVGSTLYMYIFLYVYVLQEMGTGCLCLYYVFCLGWSVWLATCIYMHMHMRIGISIHMHISVLCACVTYWEYTFSLASGWT